MNDTFLVVSKLVVENGNLVVSFTDEHEVWADWANDHSFIPEIFFMCGRGGEIVIVNYFASIEVTVLVEKATVEQNIVSTLNEIISEKGFISGFEPNREFFDALDM